MSIVQLDDIEFESQVYSKQIDWENQFAYSRVKTTQDYDMEGNLVVWQNQTRGGRPIHLVAEENEAWLDQSHVDKIFALFNTLNGVVEFRHNDQTLSVIVTDFKPTRMKGYFNDDGLQLYTAVIDLIEVINA